MKSIRSLVVISLVLAIAAAAVPRAYADTTYVVNTISDTDDGVCTPAHCSLREALRGADYDTLGVDTIHFNIPGPGPHTIAVASDLPHIRDNVILDATTEPDYHGTPVVVLDGSALPVAASAGIRVFGDDNIVRGLAVGNFGFGMVISGERNRIEGNFVGVDAAGTAARPNFSGIAVFEPNNIIGGASGVTTGSPCTTPCNVISSSTNVGVDIQPAAEHTLVTGNLIGTNAAGTAALGNAYGVITSAPRTRIGGGTSSGNVISGNTNWGVDLDGTTTRNPGSIVQNNRIGVNAAGTAAIPNGLDGVLVGNSTGVFILDNQISGNGASGVSIVGTNAAHVTVGKNNIGGNASRTGVIPNANRGVWVSSGPQATVIIGNYITGNTMAGIGVESSPGDLPATADTRIVGNTISANADGIVVIGAVRTQIGVGNGNLITGNTNNGIYIYRPETVGTVIQGNLIGIAADGETDAGNGTNGIFIGDSPGTLVGGPGAGNLISGNGGTGVNIIGENADGNVIQGNFIGTNASGMTAVANDGGVTTYLGDRTIIGGTAPDLRNVISGNTRGGVGINSDENVVQGNYIGVDAAGIGALGNGVVGLVIADASNNTIGGTMPGAGNIIANTINGPGIQVYELVATGTTRGNTILGNSIYGNQYPSTVGLFALGIDLNRDFVTPNDNDDPDGGPNRLQNFPVLTAATTDGTATTVTGTFNSRGSVRYRIEFFANRECDSSGYGEGERYLGAVEVRTGTGGNAIINATGLASTAAGEFITATATDLARNETSEFSACVGATMSAVAPIVAELRALVGSIEKLGDAGMIRSSQENALIKLYTGAIKQLEKGNTGAAVSKLNAAVNKLNAWVKAGKLDGQTGQMLIDQTNVIIATIDKLN